MLNWDKFFGIIIITENLDQLFGYRIIHVKYKLEIVYKLNEMTFCKDSERNVMLYLQMSLIYCMVNYQGNTVPSSRFGIKLKFCISNYYMYIRYRAVLVET